MSRHGAFEIAQMLSDRDREDDRPFSLDFDGHQETETVEHDSKFDSDKLTIGPNILCLKGSKRSFVKDMQTIQDSVISSLTDPEERDLLILCMWIALHTSVDNCLGNATPVDVLEKASDYAERPYQLLSALDSIFHNTEAGLCELTALLERKQHALPCILKNFIKQQSGRFDEITISNYFMFDSVSRRGKTLRVNHDRALNKILSDLDSFVKRESALSIEERARQFVEEYKPHVIVDYLDKAIVGQHAAKQAAAMALYSHVMRIAYPESELIKQVTLFYGPTGCGKTHIWRILKAISPVPIINGINSTDITQQGFSGCSLSDALQRITRTYRDAQYAVIQFDEIDKLVKPTYSSSGENVSETIQACLLTALEDGKVLADNGTAIDTSNMLFIFSGAFGDMRTKGHSVVGFTASDSGESNGIREGKLREAFIEYGIMPELAGRIHRFVSLSDLTLEDFRKILDIEAAKSNPIRAIKEQFSLENISFEITAQAKDALAKEAYELKLGARGMMSTIITVSQTKYYEALKAGETKVTITTNDLTGRKTDKI